MTDTAVANGTKQTGSELTETQYKEMCKLVRQHQLKNGKKKKGKPVLKPRGKVVSKTIAIDIEESATDFDDIEDEPFALDTNASRIYVRTGKERAKCVNTGRSIPVGGAAVYRVFL